jgi:hypothetical protein
MASLNAMADVTTAVDLRNPLCQEFGFQTTSASLVPADVGIKIETRLGDHVVLGPRAHAAEPKTASKIEFSYFFRRLGCFRDHARVRIAPKISPPGDRASYRQRSGDCGTRDKSTRAGPVGLRSCCSLTAS